MKRLTIPLLFILLVQTLLSQEQTPPSGASSMIPIAPLLDPEGLLRLDSTFNGAIDPAGYRMVLAQDGRPRFLQADSTIPIDSLDSLYHDYPGDRYWDESFGPPGIDGPAYAMAMMDGDLYVGGRFTVTGNVLAYNISRWNGRTWAKLGDGVDGTVFCLAVKDGMLYVGGSFQSAGGEQLANIARYDPREDHWWPLGFDVGINGPVRAMLATPDQLYMAGEFKVLYTRGDSLIANGVCAWNGVYWTTFGNGLSFRESPRIVGGRALAVIDNDLYVGGGFGYVEDTLKANSLARWNGNRWHAMPVLLDGMEDGANRGSPVVLSLLAVDGRLVVGGYFRNAGSVVLRNVAQWRVREQRWVPLGDGLSDTVLTLAYDGRFLYAGGRFISASKRVVNCVARFDGASWAAMQGGVFDTVPPRVCAMAVGDSNLYVGGHFIIAGRVSAHHVARWDGVAWHPLAQGFDKRVNCNGTDQTVFALATDGARLFAGGDFITAGGDTVRHVAAWDGEEWSALGEGIGGNGGLVRALAFHDGDLYVGGVFERAGSGRHVGIARWDGTAWHDVGGGVGGSTPYVFALHTTATDLYVAGAFTTAGGDTANRVVRWSFAEQRWHPLGEGVSGDSSEYVYVTTVCTFEGNVIIGGDFARAGGARSRRLARWNGSRWTAMAAGRDSGAGAPVHALVVHDGQLLAGGEFTHVGGVVTGHLARLNGAVWEKAFLLFDPSGPVHTLRSVDSMLLVGGSFTVTRYSNQHEVNNVSIVVHGNDRNLHAGVNGPVRALCLVDGVLYAGGEFSMAGKVKADHVAAWDRIGWSALGSDPTSGVYGVVRVVKVSGSDVFIGGSFSGVGGIRAYNVARWDGRRWRALGRGRANGVNGTVFAIERIDSVVFVGGAFTEAGGRAIISVAQWNGMVWLPLGGGLAGNNPYVFAMLPDGYDLYVGGAFATAGGLSANKIGRFDARAQSWSVLDSGVSGGSYYTYVSALHGSGSDLYVGGNFACAGVNFPANNVAHWDGERWSALAGGVNRSVFDLESYRGELYACGDFTAADTARTRYIARWNGVRWSRVAEGFNMPAYDMTVHDGELFVAGRFQLAGRILGMGIARWDGSLWDNLGKGLQHGYRVGTAFALDASDSGVWVGGDFTVAGGKASYYFGRWHRPTGVSAVEMPRRPSSSTDRITLRVVPDPVSSDATIGFRSPVAGRARVVIADAAGRHVDVLLDESVSAGDRLVRWSASTMAPGCYVVRVVVGSHVASTILVVQR